MTDRGKHFICLDVDLARHERIMALDEPLACLGLFAAMTMHARELLTGGPTGGRVAKRTAETMCGEKNRSRLKQMTASGLLNETDTHYEIVKYAPRNQSPEMVEESRKSGRERKAASRAKDAVVTRDMGVTDEGNACDPLSTRGRAPASSSTSEISEEGEVQERGPAPRPVRRGADAGVGYMEASLWADACRDAGRPVSEPDRWGRETIAKVANAQAPELNGEPMCEWIRSSALAYAEASQGHEDFWPLTVPRWKAWVESGSKPIGVRSAPVTAHAVAPVGGVKTRMPSSFRE